MRRVFIALLILSALIIVAIGGYFGARNYVSYFEPEYFSIHPTVAKFFGISPSIIIYRNNDYGFRMNFPIAWKGFVVQKRNWSGYHVDNSEEKFTGPEILIKNPRSTPQQAYQDIPIMVISHATWDLIKQGQVAVSAAPVGPEKIGENSKYIFATPPRWYGFTDAAGFEEAINIVKTFKAF